MRSWLEVWWNTGMMPVVRERGGATVVHAVGLCVFGGVIALWVGFGGEVRSMGLEHG